MSWVVAYDVSDDDVRSRVARVLEGYGHRVQESVFECALAEPGSLPALRDTLSALLARSAGSQVRFYRTCRDCRGASFALGAPPDVPDCWIA